MLNQLIQGDEQLAHLPLYREFVSEAAILLASPGKRIPNLYDRCVSQMKYLAEKGLDQLICSLKQPVLGICLGMQLMCASSEENNTVCLGIFSEKVKLFPATDGFKIPHIGWNNIADLKTNLMKGVDENTYMYFVHSYYVEACERAIAKTNYIQTYSSALQKDNFYAVQFHPEKSGEAGQRILENFINLTIE
jgi:glutamine amidotransferase